MKLSDKVFVLLLLLLSTFAVESQLGISLPTATNTMSFAMTVARGFV